MTKSNLKKIRYNVISVTSSQ